MLHQSLLLIVQLGIQMFCHIPVGQQAHFTGQQRFIVIGKNALLAGQLNTDQRIGGVPVQIARGVVVERGKIGGVAKV